MPPLPCLTEFDVLLRLARAEDLGPNEDDVTSRLSIDAGVAGVGSLLQKQAGVVCGLPLVERICAAYDPKLTVEATDAQDTNALEGTFSQALPRQLLHIKGPLRSLLSAERVVLNFVQHLSGVATATRQFVEAVRGTGALIIDTRKTAPGYRALDKYAVLCGGGVNHRIGLYDMILIKDNHVAALPERELQSALQAMVERSRREDPSRKIEVEVDTLEQLSQVLRVDGIDYVLLDNMDCATLRQAVALRNAAGKRASLQLEASGGINLHTVRDVALTGVERISVGAITHSAPALDIGLDIKLI
ncbi:MAG TPA: carboxylating nicotinate-nucleotide diphosphorylase [Tepidisphaeraceae bacterium]|jgi:nicotinate-nucleotide pyrophosphorylase (carboxylating)